MHNERLRTGNGEAPVAVDTAWRSVSMVEPSLDCSDRPARDRAATPLVHPLSQHQPEGT